MGKYIRKRRGGGTATAAPAVVVAGVRTRSRAATAAPVPKRLRKVRGDVQVDKVREDDGGAEEGCCYLQLRSRRLFMVVAAEVAASPRKSAPVATVDEEEEHEAFPAVPMGVTGSVASAEAVVAGVSRCSSTASSSVDAAALRERRGCSVDKAGKDCCEETSVSDSGSGREWREATPSSQPPQPGDLSDQESSKAADDDPKQHLQRSSSATATTSTVASCRARVPPAEEIEEFFAAAEKAVAERFAARYNFDVVRGVPLDAGGRFEWTPVASGG